MPLCLCKNIQQARNAIKATNLANRISYTRHRAAIHGPPMDHAYPFPCKMSSLLCVLHAYVRKSAAVCFPSSHLDLAILPLLSFQFRQVGRCSRTHAQPPSCGTPLDSWARVVYYHAVRKKRAWIWYRNCVVYLYYTFSHVLPS